MPPKRDHHASGKYNIKACSLMNLMYLPTPNVSHFAIVSSAFLFICEVKRGVYSLHTGLDSPGFLAIDCGVLSGDRMGHQWIHTSETISKPLMCNIEPQFFPGIIGPKKTKSRHMRFEKEITYNDIQ